MDRKYLAPDNVKVYDDMADHDNGGLPITTVQRVPYTLHGMDYYQVGGALRPGWVDRDEPGMPPFLVLHGPGSTMKTEAA